RLCQGAELELAVAVGEVGEHEEREPVRRALVEGAQDAGIVGIAGAPLEQGLGLLAPVAPEIAVKEVHHRPEVAAFLDIHLEEVAQVVHAGRGHAEMTLLLDRRRLGVALGNDDAAQVGPMLAGHTLPDRLAEVVAEVDATALLRGIEEDAPAVVGQLHVAELRPALGIDADRGAAVDIVAMPTPRPHGAPPPKEAPPPL